MAKLKTSVLFVSLIPSLAKMAALVTFGCYFVQLRIALKAKIQNNLVKEKQKGWATIRWFFKTDECEP
jgi:hypothetical protein